MEKSAHPRRRLSLISALHYSKLVFRSVLFLAAAAVYLVNRLRGTGDPFGGVEHLPFILAVIWLVFAVEMALRFFPSRVESMGCQKQFARNYVPAPPGVKAPAPTSPRAVWAVVAAWVTLNAGVGVLYLTGVIDRGIMLLVCLAYSVCDMICILFFCPFQTWFLKNKCCGSCRIYNWDFAMMFTPLIFIPSVYNWSLLALALALLIEWEVLYRRHPERFSEASNASLSCALCREKLCAHKTQLQRFLKERWAQLNKSE